MPPKGSTKVGGEWVLVTDMRSLGFGNYVPAGAKRAKTAGRRSATPTPPSSSASAAEPPIGVSLLAESSPSALPVPRITRLRGPRVELSGCCCRRRASSLSV